MGCDSEMSRTSKVFERQGVVRFEYNGSVRKSRYLVFMMCFGGAGAFLMYQKGSFDTVLFSAFAGVVAVALIISEVILCHVQKKAIEIDFDQRQVRLEYFVYPKSFYDIRRKPLVLITFDEILTVRRVSTSGSLWENIYVDTSSSRFVFQDYFSNFDLLMDALRQIASETEPSPLRRNPMLLGLIAGLIAFGIVGFIGYLLGWL